MTTGQILIVQSRWNESITQSLAASARKHLESSSYSIESILVPGALEIPLAIKWASQKQIVGAVACGCVIRGETHHFELVANDTSRALTELSLELRIPIGHAVLACDTQQEAIARKEKGREAAQAVLEMLELKVAKEF